MAVVSLRCAEVLVREILRLHDVNAQIVGARVEDGPVGRVLVFDIDSADAPDGAIGMDPVYQQNQTTGRVTMLNPRWITGEER